MESKQVREARISSGISLVFTTLRTRLSSVVLQYRSQKSIAGLAAKHPLIKQCSTLLQRILSEDSSGAPTARQAIMDWFVGPEGSAIFSPNMPMAGLADALYPPHVHKHIDKLELVLVSFQVAAILIRAAAEAIGNPTGAFQSGADSDVEADEPKLTGGEWHRLCDFTMSMLGYAWSRSQSESATHVLRACGEALGAISRIDLESYVNTINRMLRPYTGELDTRKGKKYPSSGVSYVFYALSFVVLPADSKVEGKSKLPELLQGIEPYASLKVPKGQEQITILYGLLEGMEHFLSQVDFGSVEEMSGTNSGRFNATSASKRRLFNGRVLSFYTWASQISKASDLGVKASALRTMCSVLVCAPRDFYRENIGSFLQKRILNHLSEPRKAHHCMILLLKVLRGPAVGNLGGRKAGGETPVTEPWNSVGPAWDRKDPPKKADLAEGRWTRTCRGKGDSDLSSMVAQNLRLVAETLFKRKLLARLPRPSLPVAVLVGAQLAVHSAGLVLNDSIRSLLPPRPKPDELLAAGVCLRVVLQILDPAFQREAFIAANKVKQVDSQYEYHKRIQSLVNQLAQPLVKTIEASLSISAGTGVLSAYYERLGNFPRRWRRLGLAESSDSHEELAAAREPVVLLPISSAAPASPLCPADSSEEKEQLGQGDMKIEASGQQEPSQIARETLSAALSVLTFVRPPLPLASLSQMLHPGSPNMVQMAAARYAQRVVAYQPEGFNTIAFMFIRAISNSQQDIVTSALITHLNYVCKSWGGACVEAASAEGGMEGPKAPGWMKSSREKALPLIQATALTMLSHTSPRVRLAALSLSREATEAEQGILQAWSGWGWGGVVRPDAFSLIRSGEHGESALALAASGRYMQHLSKFYFTSDSCASDMTVGQVPSMANIVLLAEGLSKLFVGQPEEEKKEKAIQTQRAFVGSLALNIVLGIIRRILKIKFDAPMKPADLAWHFSLLPLLFALPAGTTSKKQKRSNSHLRTPERMDRRAWKKREKSERKEAESRMETQFKASTRIAMSLGVLNPRRFEDFSKMGSGSDYACVFAAMARLAESDSQKVSMDTLIFSAENAHPSHIPEILKSLRLFSALPSVPVRGGPPNPEVRLGSGESIRRRTDALRHSIFYALTSNPALPAAMKKYPEMQVGLTTEMLRVNTERILAWTLGPIAMRNVARSIRNIASAIAETTFPEDGGYAEDSGEIPQLISPVQACNKALELLSWAQAVSDIVGDSGVIPTSNSGVPRPKSDYKSPPTRKSSSRMIEEVSQSRKSNQSGPKLDVGADNSNPSGPNSPVRTLPGVALITKKKNQISANPNSDTRSLARAILNAAKPTGLPGETTTVGEWVQNMVELRKACFEAIGAVIWASGLGLDEGKPGEVRGQNWIVAMLATSMYTPPVDVKTSGRRPSLRVTAASSTKVISYSGSRVKHPVAAYPCLAAMCVQHWDVTFPALLEEIYSPTPRGGSLSHAVAFSAISSRFSTTSDVFCRRIHRNLKVKHAIELATLGILMAGHPCLQASEWGVEIVCSLGSTLGGSNMRQSKTRGSNMRWPQSPSNTSTSAADVIVPGPAQRRLQAEKLAKMVASAINEEHKEALRQNVIRRLIAIRRIIDLASKQSSKTPAVSDPNMAPYPHLILSPKALEEAMWLYSEDSLAWFIRGSTPWLMPKIDVNIGKTQAIDALCLRVAQKKPILSITSLLAMSTVLVTTSEGTCAIVETALSKLWSSVLFEAGEEFKIQTKSMSRKASTDISGGSAQRVIMAILTCIRLLSGAPGCSVSGAFQADFLRVANLSARFQINSLPALSVCRLVAEASTNGSENDATAAKRTLQWTLRNSALLAECWWGQDSGDDVKIVGERCAWGSAGVLLSRMPRSSDDVMDEKKHDQSQVRRGRLIFHCIHHLAGPQCLASSLLISLYWSSFPKSRRGTFMPNLRIPGRKQASGLPSGLFLREFFWRPLEDDDNTFASSLADMRDPHGSWRQELNAPAPRPRHGMAALAGRPQEADRKWRLGIKKLLEEQSLNDAKVSEASEKQIEEAYLDIGDRASRLLSQNADIAAGDGSVVDSLRNLPDPAALMSADALLCSLVHALERGGRSKTLQAWAEEAIRHTERVKTEWAMARGTKAARQVRDLLAVLSPALALEIQASTRIATLMGNLIPKRHPGSPRAAKQAVSGVPTISESRIDFLTALAQALVARIWRGAAVEGASSEDDFELRDRQAAFWALMSLMETGIERIYRTALQGVLLGLDPSSTCFPERKSKITNLLHSPTPTHVHWLMRLLGRGLLRPQLAPSCLQTLTLAAGWDTAGIRKDDFDMVVERLVCLMGLALPWIYCLIDALRPMTKRSTRAAELLPPGCFDVDISPETLCASVSSCVENLLPGDKMGENLQKALNHVSAHDVMEPIYLSIEKLLAVIGSSPKAPRLAHILGSVLTALHYRGSFALQQGVLRTTTIVLHRSPNFLEIKGKSIGGLVMSLAPMARRATEIGGAPAMEMAAAYAWTARAAPPATSPLLEMSIGLAPSVKGSFTGFQKARTTLLEVGGDGWVTKALASDCVNDWIQHEKVDEKKQKLRPRPTEAKHEVTTFQSTIAVRPSAVSNISVTPSDIATRPARPERSSKFSNTPSVASINRQDSLMTTRQRGNSKIKDAAGSLASVLTSKTFAKQREVNLQHRKRLEEEERKKAEEKKRRDEDGRRKQEQEKARRKQEEMRRSKNVSHGDSGPTEDEIRNFMNDTGTGDNTDCWEEVRSGTGDIYYWNTRTDKVQWDRPACMDKPKVAAAHRLVSPTSGGHRRRASSQVHRRGQRAESVLKDQLGMGGKPSKQMVNDFLNVN